MHPILFTIGGFPIGTYGLCLVIGFFVSFMLAKYLGAQEGIAAKDIFDLSLTLLFAGVLGSKILMILVDLFNGADVIEVFNIGYLRAGGALHGGIIAAVIAFFWKAKYFDVSPLQIADCLAPAMAIGQAIGRLGCFSAGCCYGIISHSPWAITYHDVNANILSGVPLDMPLHPVQLYTSFASLLIVVILLFIWKYRYFKGQVIGCYFILEGVSRIIIEYWRGDLDRGFWLGVSWLSTGRFTSCLFVIFGIGILVWFVQNKNTRTTY